MTNQVTDLSWLVSDEPGSVNLLPVGTATWDAAEGACVVDVIAFRDDPRTAPVRLTITEAGQLVVNGEFEVRDDLMGIVGVFEELDDAKAPLGVVYRSPGINE